MSVRLRAAAALLASALPAAAPSPDLLVYARAQQLVRLPDGRRMNVHCTGQGGVPVILDGGWTTETNYWFKVQPVLARYGRVCSYDRAGYGFSEAGPLPRDADAMERDLTAMLHAAAITGPVILVAHSIASYPARLHVDRHPHDVAALVLLDPPVEGTDQAYERVRPDAGSAGFIAAARACSDAVIAGRADPPNASLCLGSPRAGLPDGVNRARAAFQHTLAYQQAAKSEVMALAEIDGAEVARSRRRWGAMPVIVLTAEDGDADPSYTPTQNEALRAIRWRAQEGVAALSTRRLHRLLPGASHFIPIDSPAAAIQAVRGAKTMIAGEPVR